MIREAYKVELVDRAFEYMLDLGDAQYGRTMTFLDLLASNPRLGRIYEPEYDASLPPVTCRRVVVPKTTVELFYYVDEGKRKVRVMHACDARSDPRNKFVGFHVTNL